MPAAPSSRAWQDVGCSARRAALAPSRSPSGWAAECAASRRPTLLPRGRGTLLLFYIDDKLEMDETGSAFTDACESGSVELVQWLTEDFALEAEQVYANEAPREGELRLDLRFLQERRRYGSTVLAPGAVR